MIYRRSICTVALCSFFSLQLWSQRFNPSDWKVGSQRPALAPAAAIDNQILLGGQKTLYLKGGGKSYSNGYWHTKTKVLPGEYFRFKAYFKTSRIKEPNRSVLATITWLDGFGNVIGNEEYPSIKPGLTNGWSLLENTYRVPLEAVNARIALIFRWAANGQVNFGDVSFIKTTEPASKTVRIATVCFRPSGNSSPQENLDQFSKFIEEAAIQKADIVCLPEEMTLVGTSGNYISASEPIPGPSTLFLGKLASRFHMYIVAGLLEKENSIVYNTSVLIDRSGNLAGKYRKVSLPVEEIEGGITPGDSLPVFETDFGRIGMMICWDVTFPEVARQLAKKGAEIIFLPIWGGNINLTKARAIENQVYVVSSSYDMKSAVFDLDGEVLEEATKNQPVISVDIDLNKRKLWPGIGDLKSRISKEMPAEKSFH